MHNNGAYLQEGMYLQGMGNKFSGGGQVPRRSMANSPSTARNATSWRAEVKPVAVGFVLRQTFVTAEPLILQAPSGASKLTLCETASPGTGKLAAVREIRPRKSA
jgi:hypothetical protein